MNSIRLLVQVTAITSMLSGCGQKATSDSMPHVENDAAQQQEQKSNTLWQSLKSSMGLSASNGQLDLDYDAYSQTITRSSGLFAYVSSVCEAQNLPAETAFIPLMMSGYNPEYYEDGRSGLWGLDDAQAASLALPNDYWLSGKNDIVMSTNATASYLKYLHSTFKQDWDLALTAFRHGITPVIRAVHQNQSLGKPITLEELPIDPSMKHFATELKEISHHLINNHETEAHGTIEQSDQIQIIDMPSQYDLSQAADILQINPQQLKRLNSGYRRPASPPQGPFRLIVPAALSATANKTLKDPTTVSQTAKKPWIRHKVSSGESLSIIAQKYMTNVKDLKRVNNIKDDQIMVNQLILIPPVDRTDVRTKPSNIPGPQKITHTVQQDETLYSISKNFEQNVSDVMYWNNLSAKSIHPGQQLIIWKNADIESPYMYRVKTNDSLSKIARAHHTTVEKLKQVNQLSSSVIHPNSILIIPHKG